MSGDVTAAIEGMKAYFARSEPKPWPRLDYVHTLLAEVERLQSVEWRTNEHRDQASANFDSMMKAKDEVERLRAEVRDLSVLADSEAIERTYGRLREENQRLRAEREALHSDETRARLTRAVNSLPFTVQPITMRGRTILTRHDKHGQGVGTMTSAETCLWNALNSMALAADPEADQ